jgi:adenosylmethionine-8-amino-7-oxononanoate aminotransferase
MKTAPVPTAVAATKDCHIILEDGRELIDGCSSWWTACHGYNHPHIIGEVKAQLEKMPHIMMGGLANEQAYRLATRLAAILPGDLNRVFLCESGSVSVEVAMKMAIQFWINQGHEGHKSFLNFDHGYHGDTMGAMSVCDVDRGMHQVFKGALVEQHRLPLPTDEASRKVFDQFLTDNHKDLAGIIMEPLVQGAGGLKFHSEETLRYIRARSEHHGVLLILDEIMTGFGRLGSMFACEAAGIVPDIITLSKALTGGTLPLAAAISSDRVSAAFLSDDDGAALMHGPTYMGNPLGCAAANASLDLFEREPRMEQIGAIEAHFNKVLPAAQNFKGIKDVRAKGAIGVIEVHEMKEIEWLKTAFIERGVFIRPMSNVIYVAPPFVISSTELESLTDAMLDVTRAWSQKFC